MSAKIHRYNDSRPNQYFFHCPGCGNDHGFTVGEPRRGPDDPRWTWNGSLEKPTFAPSLLRNKDFPESRCHSFVVDGKIQFQPDCWHELKGQTVDLPNWESA